MITTTTRAPSPAIRIARRLAQAPVPRLPRVAVGPRAEDGAHPRAQRHRSQYGPGRSLRDPASMQARAISEHAISRRGGARRDPCRSEHAPHLAEGRAVKFATRPPAEPYIGRSRHRGRRVDGDGVDDDSFAKLTTASTLSSPTRRRAKSVAFTTEVLRRRVKLCLVRVDADHRRPRPAELGLGEERALCRRRDQEQHHRAECVPPAPRRSSRGAETPGRAGPGPCAASAPGARPGRHPRAA